MEDHQLGSPRGARSPQYFEIEAHGTRATAVVVGGSGHLKHNLARRQSYALHHKQQECRSPGGNVRPNARLVLGYYPLPNAEAARIRRFLEFPSSAATALDPCAGAGTALAAMTAASNARR